MALTPAQSAFLERQHSAAMITPAPGGPPKVVRVGVAVVDGQIWSSGTADRVRTRRLRRDPTCTLFVFEQGFAFLALETTVRILEGPDSSAANLRLFRVMQGRTSGPLSWFGEDLDEDAFLARMVEEGRLIYEFEVHHAYGMV